MNLRPATSEDLELLWEFLALAAYEPDAAAAKKVPVITHYLEGWQRPSDFGLVAEHRGRPVGAAWARQFGATGNPFYLNDQTPEVAVAVIPEMRGQGVGTLLLRELIDEAATRGLGLCLNVRHTSPAVRLYERLGFRPMPGWEVRNRTGGYSVGMVLDR